MTLPRREIEGAAFWGFAICLDCQALADPDLVDDRTTCPACNSSRIVEAELLLACADFVEPDDES